MKKAWKIRKATMEDRDSIIDLCRVAISDDDYVIVMLDELIKKAATFIALDGRKVIGMMVYHRQLDGTGWISSARTHPDYRRGGVAASIVRALESHGRGLGAKALRLWTEGDNELGKAAFFRIGFREVGRFTRLIASEAESGFEKEVVKLSYSDYLWKAVKASQIAEGSKLYVNHGFGFVKLDPAVLNRFADEGFLYGWDGTVAALTEFFYMGTETLEGQILVGDLSDGLRSLRSIAQDFGIKLVQSFPPHSATLLPMARDAGYDLMEWGNEAILCEMSI